MQGLPATLSIEEAGRLLGFGRDTAYAAARSGALPTILIGKRKRRVPTSHVLQLLGGGQARPQTLERSVSEDPTLLLAQTLAGVEAAK